MKKRNPNDSTFRNITALKKQVKALEERLICHLTDIEKRIDYYFKKLKIK